MALQLDVKRQVPAVDASFQSLQTSQAASIAPLSINEISIHSVFRY